MRSYYFYFTTNSSRQVLYCGMTNSLYFRIMEHYIERGSQKSFTGRYYCYYLVYSEVFTRPMDAIRREKEVKKWSRRKKERLIATKNPEWIFLNAGLYGRWPPDAKDLVHRGHRNQHGA